MGVGVDGSFPFYYFLSKTWVSILLGFELYFAFAIELFVFKFFAIVFLLVFIILLY